MSARSSDTVKRERATRALRAEFDHFVSITTRWHDNDVYGHINNTIYYGFFDTAVNQILIEAGVLDLATSSVVGLVVETTCTYFESIAFPQGVEVGVRAAHIGSSSVRYALAIFRAGDNQAAAQGEFTHVYVDRKSRRPIEVPIVVRAVLERLAGHAGD